MIRTQTAYRFVLLSIEYHSREVRSEKKTLGVYRAMREFLNTSAIAIAFTYI